MTRTLPPRRHVLFAAPLLLATAPLLGACGTWRRVDGAPHTLAPLRYNHLTPLRLNVAVVDIEEAQPPPLQGDLGAAAPTPPVAALRQMAQDRIQALGGSGRAVFTIREARVSRVRGGLDGAVAVRLDVFASDGTPLGYAEARAARRQVGEGDERRQLYDIVRLMLETLNVEFEFQVRRNLRGLLAADGAAGAAGAAVPAPVERQDLAPPATR